MSKKQEKRGLAFEDDSSHAHAQYDGNMKNTERIFRQIDFPPLTEAQEKELEALEEMQEEDINTEDIPEVDFSDAALRYASTKGKSR